MDTATTLNRLPARLLLAAIGVALVGCVPLAQPQRVDEDPAERRNRQQVQLDGDRVIPQVPTAEALDAQPRASRRFALSVYELLLPAGQVSSNETLWRRINEQAIGVGDYDLLWTNGLRVGVATNEELAHVAESLDREQAPLQQIFGASESLQIQQLPVGERVPRQTVFWFDQNKQPVGRTFHEVQLALNLAFEQAPGQRNAVRIGVRPIVEGLRRLTRVRPSGSDYEVREGYESTPLDVHVLADVPLGSFLIVSPSSAGKWDTSVGNVFFGPHVKGEPMERILVIVPQRMEFEQQVTASAGR